jgi:hypothetical protein
MSWMDYDEARRREIAEQHEEFDRQSKDDQHFEPPFCDNCAEEHATENCPFVGEDDDDASESTD